MRSLPADYIGASGRGATQPSHYRPDTKQQPTTSRHDADYYSKPGSIHTSNGHGRELRQYLQARLRQAHGLRETLINDCCLTVCSTKSSWRRSIAGHAGCTRAFSNASHTIQALLSAFRTHLGHGWPTATAWRSPGWPSRRG
jgi:hypothetical protein